MKNRIVTWGTNAAEEKLLIALELKTEDNKIMLYTFPQSIATEGFVNLLMTDWREGNNIEFPEGHTAIERQLSVTESLLPEDIKVSERGDIVQRAQTEWHFQVLSTKLHEAYQQELEEFREKIQQMTSYDNKIFVGLRAFWDKVQQQSQDRTLFREHVNKLRDNINVLFEELKKTRNQVNKEFSSASAATAQEFNKSLDEIDELIAAGGVRLSAAFENLKKLQQQYRNARMTNEHRNKIWARIDGAFKKAKDRRYGINVDNVAASERNDKRMTGLAEALKRIEDGVARDEEELEFQRKKVNKTDGQLEAQIRLAKIKLIEERLVGKKIKIEDLKQSMASIERQAEASKAKDARRAEKAAEQQRIQEVKEAVKSEIAQEIRMKSGAKPEDKKEDSLFEAASTVLGDVLMDALDSAKAVASVVAEKAGETFDKASEKSDSTIDKAKSVANTLVDKAEIALEKAMDKAEEALEQANEQGADSLGKAKALAGVFADQAKEVFEKVMDKAEEALESFTAKDSTESVDPASAEAAKAADDNIIIEDVVHKSSQLESTEKADGIIIEDVVHKSEAAEENVEKPKKAPKKKDA
jgi:ABC-type transporter Mla subunit MlaD